VGRPVQVLLLRFLERVGKGARTAPRDSLISGSIRKNEAGKSFGFHKAMDNSGAIIGPLTASLLLFFFPLKYSIVFIIATIPAIFGVISIIAFVRERSSAKNVARLSSVRKLPSKFWFFLIVVFVFSLGNSTDALLIVRTSETGIKSSYVPFIYMIFNSVSVLLAIPAGKLSDRIGREKLIIAGFLTYSLVYFLFGVFNSIAVFIAAFILYGAYSAFADGAQKALVSDLTTPQIKGTGYGIYHAVVGITLLPASLIAGILYDHAGSSSPFYFGSLMALCAAILMIIFMLKSRVQKSK
jgi:MFS family permease